jgi:zinc D-Ala-D-Ala carboxypeptidase
MTMLCTKCWGSKVEDDQSSCVQCSGSGVLPDEQLSSHFRLGELLFSDTAMRQRIDNTPPLWVMGNLRSVACGLLDPIRDEFGAIHVNSGFRSPLVNAAINGSSKTSVHPLGLAADIRPCDPTVTRKMIVDFVIAAKLPYDQVIFEGTWVHVGRFGPDGKSMRGEALSMFPGPDGKPHYGPYDPNDPRVST